MCGKQLTLIKAISFTGRGLHTGKEVKMTVKPAEINYGIKFQRVDIADSPLIDALAENVSDTSRGTTISKKGVSVSTIEHIVAALWGSGVDNALVEIDGPEVPIMDGSARFYVEAIAEAGIEEQDAQRVYYTISDKIVYQIPDKGVSIEAYPDDKYSVDVNIDFNSEVLGCQYAKLNETVDFAREIAPCRTFVFVHELEPLLENNLIKGGDLDNAIVIVERMIADEQLEKLKKVFNRPGVKVEGRGILNNINLSFCNEPARHKLLDVVGDLALAGVRLRGRIIANKPGHFANTEFAKILRKQIKADEGKPKIKYDPNIPPVLDVNGIKRILPHRPPFLLVDKIIQMDESSVYGVKAVTMNEPFFVGHFPAAPVMPGVLIVEAMAQCGGILALQSVPDPENYLTFFMKIDEVRFKRQVVPGDTLLFALELAEPIRRGVVVMTAKAYVGDNLAVEGKLMALITKDKK